MNPHLIKTSSLFFHSGHMLLATIILSGLLEKAEKLNRGLRRLRTYFDKNNTLNYISLVDAGTVSEAFQTFYFHARTMSCPGR
jgi:hypothetical protein